MSEDLYRKLQERLDKYSIGFPATETGVEIKILKKLFSEDDAKMFLAMSPMLEAPGAIAEKVGKSAEQVSAHLADMSERGLVFRLKKGDAVRYGAIPFVHGLFEFQVNRLDREMVELLEEYGHAGFKDAMVKSADTFLRTVPVGQAVPVEHQIASYEDARAILDKKSLIVVADCICRKAKAKIEQGCDKPMEACFMFGSMGQYYLDHGMGREVDADEALAIVQKCQEAGLVTQPASSQNPGGMCNCCGDCCGVLSALNMEEKPAEHVFSNHFAVIDKESCSACETCLERCQMDAIKIDGGLASINLDRCIGCGLCVMACPEEAMSLKAKPDDQRRTPPPNTFEQMMHMARKRGVML